MVPDEQHHSLCNLEHNSLVSMQHNRLRRDTGKFEDYLHNIQNPQACNEDVTQMPRAWVFHLCFSRHRPVSVT